MICFVDVASPSAIHVSHIVSLLIVNCKLHIAYCDTPNMQYAIYNQNSRTITLPGRPNTGLPRIGLCDGKQLKELRHSGLNATNAADSAAMFQRGWGGSIVHEFELRFSFGPDKKVSLKVHLATC